MIQCFFTEDTIFSLAYADNEIEEQVVSVTAQAVADILKERPTKAWDPRKESFYQSFQSYLLTKRSICFKIMVI